MQLTFNDLTGLKHELDHFADTLTSVGYIDYRLDSLQKKKNNLYIGFIFLGKRIEELRIHTKSSFILAYAKKLNLNLKDDYFTIDPSHTSEILKKFSQMEAEDGRPLTYFQLREIKRNSTYLDTRLTYNRENLRDSDAILVKGYEKFPRSYITHYANLKIGRPYKQSKINESGAQLGQLPFVKMLREPEVLFSRDSTQLFLYLEKKEANRFEGFLGFGTDEQTGSLRLDGNINLTLVNNLNFGESLDISYKSDGDDQQNLMVALEAPFLASTPLGFRAGLKLFRQDSTFSTTIQNIALSYIINKRSYLRIGADFENSNNLLKDDVAVTALPRNFKKNLLGAGYSLAPIVNDRLTGISNLVDLYISMGKRLTAEDAETQLNIKLEAAYTFNFGLRHQFFIANSTKSLSSKTFLYNELFRFGGNNSIRGFQENSLFGNRYTTFQTEYRYIPTTNLYVHTIIDASYYENDILKNASYIYSFGAGAGILTAAGILNFNIAAGMQENQGFKFFDSIVHLQFRVFF